MNSVKKTKKHSYLLLELLIAIALLGAFLGPLLSSPLSSLKRQQKELLLLEMQLKGEVVLIKAEEQLRQGEISWKEVVKASEDKCLLENLSSPKEGIFVHLQKASFSEANDGGTVALVTVGVSFQKKNTTLHKTSGTFFLIKRLLDSEPRAKDVS